MDVKTIKQALDEKGELMIKTDSGEVFELHKHNVTFEESAGLIHIDGGDELYWIDASKVEYYWIHKAAKEE